MLNKVQLIGHLGHAPDIRFTQSGKEVATLSLATDSQWKNAQDEGQTKTEWHRITIFREPTINWVKEYLRKGDYLLVEGKLVYSEKEDKLGHKKRTAHVLISGWDGTIQLIRSQKSSTNESDSALEETTPPQENVPPWIKALPKQHLNKTENNYEKNSQTKTKNQLKGNKNA